MMIMIGSANLVAKRGLSWQDWKSRVVRRQFLYLADFSNGPKLVSGQRRIPSVHASAKLRSDCVKTAQDKYLSSNRLVVNIHAMMT